jgi:hypothetical protein
MTIRDICGLRIIRQLAGAESQKRQEAMLGFATLASPSRLFLRDIQGFRAIGSARIGVLSVDN